MIADDFVQKRRRLSIQRKAEVADFVALFDLRVSESKLLLLVALPVLDDIALRQPQQATQEYTQDGSGRRHHKLADLEGVPGPWFCIFCRIRHVVFPKCGRTNEVQLWQKCVRETQL